MVASKSGLGCQFWFRAATAGEDTHNVTFKERLCMTQYQAMYGEKKDGSDNQAFGCRAKVYLDKQHQEKGKHTPKAKEAVYAEFLPNMSARAF